MKYLWILGLVTLLATSPGLAASHKRKATVKGRNRTLSCKSVAIKAAFKDAWKDARDSYKSEIKDWEKGGSVPEDKPEFYAPSFSNIEVDDKDANVFHIGIIEQEECLNSIAVTTKPHGSQRCEVITTTTEDEDCG